MDGASAPADPAPSHIRVSTALGVAAIPRREQRESEGGVSSAEAEAVVCAATSCNASPARGAG